MFAAPCVAKAIQEAATGKPYYPTIQKHPPHGVRAAHLVRVIAFIAGIVAALVFIGWTVYNYVDQDLLDREARWYEVKQLKDPLFPDIYTCNNVPVSGSSNHTTDLFPKDQGCFRTSFSSEENPQPCRNPYVRKNLSVANRSCLLYQGEIAHSLADILRIVVDVGNESTVNTPWEGAFMFLKYPDGDVTVSLSDAASSRWYILSPNRYYLVRIKERRYPIHTSSNSLAYDEGVFQYEVMTPEAAPLQSIMPNMSETTVVIDLLYQTFTSLQIHHYELRTLSNLLTSLGAAAGWFSFVLVAGVISAAILKCICASECLDGVGCCCDCEEWLPDKDNKDKSTSTV